MTVAIDDDIGYDGVPCRRVSLRTDRPAAAVCVQKGFIYTLLNFRSIYDHGVSDPVFEMSSDPDPVFKIGLDPVLKTWSYPDPL